ncbi:MAG: hypothetical protein HY606_01760, partial [Planctomycetes bacterium]|nr:hypothetical protein [Planctomycetota bacterium]
IALDYTDGSSIANSATVAIGLDPFRPNDTIFLGRGIYAGKTQGFQNLLRNGSFEYWNGSLPLNWDLGTKETNIFKIGSTSAKLTGVEGASNLLPTYLKDYLKSGERWVTAGGWVRSDIVAGASIRIVDGANPPSSGFNTLVNTWEYVFAKHKVSTSATVVRVDIIANSPTVGSYFDGISLVEGENVPAYMPKPYTDAEAFVLPIINFTSGDETPSVLGGNIFKVDNSGATTISAFDDGVVGQKITLGFTNANTTLSGNTLKLSAAFTSTANDTMVLIYDGTNWLEISRSRNP